MPDNDFATWLRDVLLARRLSRAELAERLGITRSAVAQWTAGDTLPEWVTLEDVFGALSSSVSEQEDAESAWKAAKRERR